MLYRVLHTAGRGRLVIFQGDGLGAGDAVSSRVLMIALLVLVSVGLAAAQADPKPELAASVEEDDSSLRQIPYTINADEVQGAFEILAGFDSVLTDFSNTVPADDVINYYLLITARGEAIAQDVFIPGIKENVAFNAENSVPAMAFLDPRLSQWETSEVVELYKRFDDHQNFKDIAQKVREAKGLRFTDTRLAKRIEQLTQDVAVEYLEERGFTEGPE